jgi:hypothetical protein
MAAHAAAAVAGHVAAAAALVTVPAAHSLA